MLVSRPAVPRKENFRTANHLRVTFGLMFHLGVGEVSRPGFTSRSA